MNIGFLFNADHSSLKVLYGYHVMAKILESNVLQQSGRQMRASVGDIPTFSAAASSDTPTTGFLIEVCRAVYQTEKLDLLIQDRLESTFSKQTVCCWLIQNISESSTRTLHEALERDDSYLGAMEVDFSTPLHLRFFRNALIEKYRFEGKVCSVFFSMGENEDPDICEVELIEASGFRVEHQNIGARRTIFDNYDTLDHFKRVEGFKRIFGSFEKLCPESVSDLALKLEELHPKLFEVLAAAARTFEVAETEEDLAQASLSGRRFIEQLADYLYPPRLEEVNGRKVGPAESKNRLWAFIEQILEEPGQRDSSKLVELGKQLNDFFETLNKGLHQSLTSRQLEKTFGGLVIWLAELISISPSSFQQPYLAYEKSMREFFAE